MHVRGGRRATKTLSLAVSLAQLFEVAQRKGMPAVRMREVGGEQAVVTTKWKYYRMDPKAFLSMGILKVWLLGSRVRVGVHVTW